MKSIEERFWGKFGLWANSGCWIWIAATNGKYGILGAGGRGRSPVYAHRVSYQINRGPIPRGMYVIHICDTPLCVNPLHLRLGTQKDNMRDCVSRKRHISGWGLVSKGRRSPRAKFTQYQVKRMRSLRKSGWSLRGLAQKYGVAFQTISKIVRGDRYKPVQCGKQEWP